MLSGCCGLYLSRIGQSSYIISSDSKKALHPQGFCYIPSAQKHLLDSSILAKLPTFLPHSQTAFQTSLLSGVFSIAMELTGENKYNNKIIAIEKMTLNSLREEINKIIEQMNKGIDESFNQTYWIKGFLILTKCHILG